MTPNRKQLKTDIVFITDTSDSITATGKLTHINDALESMLSIVKKAPPNPDIRDTWLGIEMTLPGTNFNETVHIYLNSVNSPTPIEFHSVISNQEDGAHAIADVCKHFDWRSNAMRIIAYIGDEGMRLGTPMTADDARKTMLAKNTAVSQNVRVFTFYAPSKPHTPTENIYKRLANETQGAFYNTTSNDFHKFESDLKKLSTSHT